MIRLSLLLAMLLLSACGRKQVDLPAAPPAEPVQVTAHAPGFDGEINIDARIAAVATLRGQIEPRMRATMAETQVAAAADRAARGVETDSGYFFDADWTGSDAGDRYLNVLGKIAAYSGGAHPMTNYDAYVWDRLREQRLRLADLLAQSPADSDTVAALADMVRNAVIAAKTLRSADYDPTKDSFIGTDTNGIFAPDLARFGRNVRIALPASPDVSGGLTFNFAPYDVGPYSDGAFEVTVPAAEIGPYLKSDVVRLIGATSVVR